MTELEKVSKRTSKDKMILKKIYLNVGSHHHCSTFRAKKRTKIATHLSFEKLQVILLPKLEQKKT